jgi:hypothetical protein
VIFDSSFVFAISQMLVLQWNLFTSHKCAYLISVVMQRVGDALAATALQEGDVYLQTLQPQQDAPPSPVRSTDGLVAAGVSGGSSGSSGKEEGASTGTRCGVEGDKIAVRPPTKLASLRPAEEGIAAQIASGSTTQAASQGSVPVTHLQSPDV